MTNEPTMGELMRRMDELTRQISNLVDEITRERQATAATYVRADVLKPTMDGIDARFADVERDVQDLDKERDRQQARNRQLWMTVIAAPFGLLLLDIAVNVLHIHTG